jgi:hypothetical protein
MISRSLLAAALLAAPAAIAGPPLTTIQDVLYKADGTRFNGAVTISWTSFEAIDSSAIATQSTTLKVVDGNLRVQLVPTTSSNPPVFYTVRYNSDGRIQFEETWAVPSSAQTLRVRDVRVSTGASVGEETGAGAGGGVSVPIAETDVIGLIADLGSRPLKGPGYAAGRVAVVNPLGALESAVGSPSDCVRVDGSSGPCGSPAPSFVDGDSPSGIVDGANTLFSLSAIPDPVSSLAVYRNGMLQKSGLDYTIVGRTIHFTAGLAPQPGDTLLASYRLGDAVDSGASQLYPTAQVLCSGVGAVVNGADFASMGTCAIPAGILIPGDRLDIRFDVEHGGAASAFTFEVVWGATAILRRDASAAEPQVTGRANAALLASGARLSHQSWGGVLPFAAGVASAADAWTGGIVIDFRGKLAAAGETLALRGYTVTRLP